ncbi:hypothetical protein RvY_13999 [Ramazzottius varieornatus]|uniref:FAM32A-like n=1 Tax=Ramazzottius varieornatus TaxID=947166 RepID=A0A1D1VTQ7_RAMVA|nr:hypothetical protein RvY_13999 [Ramazzottius varieornatus]
MSDQYTHAVKSTLKLKTVGPSSAEIKKKKKKKKVEKKMEAVSESQPMETLGNVDTKRPNSASSQAATSKTKAQLKFQEMQEKRQTERILKKAEKTHKQRVEEFNKHLDSLSEHYDIPKVSWTK